MEIMLVVIIVIAVVIASRAKAAAQEQQARKERIKQQENTRRTSHYDPAAVQPAIQVPGQIHLSDVLPDKKPPAVPVTSARMPFAPTEGVAFHPPGFHGEEKRQAGTLEKKPLEKVDLGTQRAQQNVHTAANADWKAPAEKQEKMRATKQPMYTAKQLRDAFIMQEILDEPVSRRKGIKRGYGS